MLRTMIGLYNPPAQYAAGGGENKRQREGEGGEKSRADVLGHMSLHPKQWRLMNEKQKKYLHEIL